MYLFFDTETTGIPRNWNAPVTQLDNWPRLVELAWVLCDDAGTRVAGCAAIVKPEGFVIPGEAAAVHGISTERARQEGRDLAGLLREFVQAVDDAELLVAHNMSFDEKIVGAELLRTGVPSRFEQATRFCTMKASTELVGIPNRYGFKWPKLEELHQKLFGRAPEVSHAAGADAEACAACFFELQRMGLAPVVPPVGRTGRLF